MTAPTDPQGIDGLNTRGDVERFVQNIIQRPGAVTAQSIGGMDAFLQLRITRGSEILTGTGGGGASVSVAHGLTDAKGNAIVPAQIIVTTEYATIVAGVSARDENVFALYNQHVNDAATYTNPVQNDWIAIG